jgi:hypothetical protein
MGLRTNNYIYITLHWKHIEQMGNEDIDAKTHSVAEKSVVLRNFHAS